MKPEWRNGECRLKKPSDEDFVQFLNDHALYDVQEGSQLGWPILVVSNSG